MHMGKDIKVLLNGKELLVRNVEVSYSVEDLPSVSIEGYMPRDFETTMEVTYDEGAEDIIRDLMKKKHEADMLEGKTNMRGYDGDCEAKCADDGSYGAHSIAKKFVNLQLDDRQKLIARHDLKQEDGTLTAKGKELVLAILFEEYEDEVVEALEAIDAAAKEARESREY